MSLLAVALLYYYSKSDLGNINYVPDMSKCLGYCNYMYLYCTYIVIIFLLYCNYIFNYIICNHIYVIICNYICNYM